MLETHTHHLEQMTLVLCACDVRELVQPSNQEVYGIDKSLSPDMEKLTFELSNVSELPQISEAVSPHHLRKKRFLSLKGVTRGLRGGGGA